jgi:UDP:flavonoid glycosyltransferase YjiC (YdhE family)
MPIKTNADCHGRAIIALVSARGGGDRAPVLALASALQKRGQRVHLLCDGDLRAAVESTRLPRIDLPRSLEQDTFYDLSYILRIAARGERIEADTPDPLRTWADACLCGSRIAAVAAGSHIEHALLHAIGGEAGHAVALAVGVCESRLLFWR